MPKRVEKEPSHGSRLDRRSFVKTSGAAAAVSAGTLFFYKFTPSVLAQPMRPKADKIDNRLYFLTIEGSPYDRGLQHGQALRYVIQSGIARWKQWINETLEQSDAEIEVAEFVQGTDFMGTILKHTPDLYVELQGIAAGANVDFNTLYAYNMFDEFVSFTIQKYRLGFCTSFGVYGRKNLPNMIGQNNDLPPYFDRTQTLLWIKQADDFETFVFTFAGLLANNGLNNASLGCVINIMPTRLGGDLTGLPMPYLVRGILERKNRKDATDFVKGVGQYAGPMNYIIGDPGGVSSVETGKDFFRVHESYNGESYIPHANHPIEMTSDMKPGEASKSLSRHNKLVELIGGKVNEIDVEAARRIFRTYPILKNYQTDPNFPTLESVVIELDPANPRISIAAGPPDIFKYSTFDFQKGYVGTET